MSLFPYKPEPVGDPLAPISLEEALQALNYEAHRIERSAHAAVSAGFMTEPDPQALRRAKALTQAGIVLEFLIPAWPEVKRLLQRKRYA